MDICTTTFYVINNNAHLSGWAQLFAVDSGFFKTDYLRVCR